MNRGPGIRLDRHDVRAVLVQLQGQVFVPPGDGLLLPALFFVGHRVLAVEGVGFGTAGPFHTVGHAFGLGQGQFTLEQPAFGLHFERSGG